MSADTVAAGSMSDGDGVPSRRIWELVRKSTVLGAHLLLSNGDGNAESLLWVTRDELRRYIEEVNDTDRGSVNKCVNEIRWEPFTYPL